jgi:hypothetical protein
LDVHKLLSIINQHTLNLIHNEIEFLENTYAAFSEDYENFLSETKRKLENLITEKRPCEAILRIGKFTGFNTLTGAWHEKLLEYHDYEKIFNLLRGDQEVMKYPKTRRANQHGFPLGFLSIRLNN